jgi:sodium-independent sulfate anion transporter 11
MKRAVAHSNNRDSTFSIEESKVNNLKSMGTCYEWKRKARSKVKGACTVELLRRRFPILKWIPSYYWDFAVYDVIAGITVGLTTIPQGIAYAAVAGLPLQVKKKSIIKNLIFIEK